MGDLAIPVAAEAEPAEIEAIPDLKEMASADASESDKALAAHLELCAELARSGPAAMSRRGVVQRAVTPWNPPKHIEFEHPTRGKLRAELATGAVEKVPKVELNGDSDSK